MLTYLLPTHDRSQRLRRTLHELGRLDFDSHQAIGGAEVVVIDNASTSPVQAPGSLPNGLPLRLIRVESNLGAAARNYGVEEARGEWVVMLDDDSYPLDSNHIDVLLRADDSIAAVGADIVLSNGAREAGGLPEVFVGCGVAIRKHAFLDAGGYDRSFDYYAEEYDLCARLILNGWGIVHDPRFRVRHDKVAAGRDMNRILHRLVRNNGWVMQRYAPMEKRAAELAEIVSRYAAIALKENAARGFAQGAAELLNTLASQPRREMPTRLFDRFTGLEQVRETLAAALKGCPNAAIVNEGKNCWAVRQVLDELHIPLVADETAAEIAVIGTLSPGPMEDAFEQRTALGQRVIRPWIHQANAAKMDTRAQRSYAQAAGNCAESSIAREPFSGAGRSAAAVPAPATV